MDYLNLLTGRLHRTQKSWNACRCQTDSVTSVPVDVSGTGLPGLWLKPKLTQLTRLAVFCALELSFPASPHPLAILSSILNTSLI